MSARRASNDTRAASAVRRQADTLRSMSARTTGTSTVAKILELCSSLSRRLGPFLSGSDAAGGACTPERRRWRSRGNVDRARDARERADLRVAHLPTTERVVDEGQVGDGPRYADVFARGDAARRALPMTPEELLEAATLVYLHGLGITAKAAGGGA